MLVVKVANISMYKDHPTLLRAWKLVQDKWRGADKPVLALAGHQANRYDECLRLVSETGLESAVRFLGSVTDVPALIQAADLTVFSSPAEGMPNGVLECMAAGKAVVASDLPGIRDILGAENNACLVPPGDAARFAEKLLNLLQDDGKREALAQHNRERGADFSVERLAERYLQLIRAGMPNHGAGAHPQLASVRS
jgi:glycosyltransferase involved in cell wall biosynthesis